ncbi:MAG: putative Fe-S cluster assembly protein SufT [Pseudomonadota bacterium]|nr:putative Fe-S cluster assembly protein SufT [Pseudomonadota bacterium]MEC8346569.1 putative Fe-S cluster assembly protein SufT [Pseudomonadota bacterium]MEC8438261.1 putative Fe-S cluster assembly protein SufT [Pseudomonadota bacterium]MEC8492501.1 putative Fe-S cluster assembly protein SufT [Pseudomonadota bacterium]MEC8619602.1 putative Fe-S cluster assembly protein SufT [Pseudomonadota bacterium]
MERRIVTTSRDCPGRLVPTGDPITIPRGAFITLTQTLGGSFTVVVNGNMARIAGADADAIGLRVEPLTFADSDTPNVVDTAHVWHALRSVYDPEIPVNIADLGLIYAVRVEDDKVDIDMTLTAPGCGMGPVLIEEVKDRVRQVPNLTDVEVALVFEPPWSRDMMTEEAQLELGVF